MSEREIKERERHEARPVVGGLVVPYMVDATRNPVDFKIVDAEHVKRCATARRCGICGRKIRNGLIAFIGPNDGRSCFADPWMHEDCARLAMSQCPFLTSRTSWREDGDNPLLRTYARNMKVFVAEEGQAHRDAHGAWHFKAIGELRQI